MNFMLGVSAIFLAAALIMNFRALYRGPTIHDRFVVSDVISGLVVALLLLGFRFHQERYFLELALVLTAVSWIAVLGVVRFGRSSGG